MPYAPFVAAGFFVAPARFLAEVPFDPFLPWVFMGEEISLSTRLWTHGWDIFAPPTNVVAHEYRPGRLGLPKFWETVARVFNRPGFNTPLMLKVVQRVKHMIGYPDSALEKLTAGQEKLRLGRLVLRARRDEPERRRKKGLCSACPCPSLVI